MVSEMGGVPDKYVHEPWKMPRTSGRRGLRNRKHYPPPIVDEASARKKGEEDLCS